MILTTMFADLRKDAVIAFDQRCLIWLSEMSWRFILQKLSVGTGYFCA